MNVTETHEQPVTALRSGDLLAAISERKEYLKAHRPDAYRYPTLWARWDAQLAELARTEKIIIEMAANEKASNGEERNL